MSGAVLGLLSALWMSPRTWAADKPASFSGVSGGPRFEGVDAVGGGERAVVCPPGSGGESEPSCGLPIDTTNGGCGSQFQAFSNLLSGQTVCGTAQFNGATRDTDWYQFTLTSQRYVTIQVSSSFKAQVGFIAGTNGVANCALATGVSPFTLVQPNQTGEVSACLGPGTWWAFISPDFDQGNVACGSNYWLKLLCTTPCPTGACCLSNGLCEEVNGLSACLALNGRYQGDFSFCDVSTCNPPANDACASAVEIVCNGSFFADTRNATLAPGETTPICAAPGGVASVWYKIRGTGGPVSITTCDTEFLDPIAKDSIIGVYLDSGPCGTGTLLACSDDAACGATERLSTVCFPTSTGSTYLIQILPYSNADRGTFKVDVICPCAVTTTGACCLANGQCVSANRQACDSLLGFFQGDGSSCAGVACPNLPPPPNDDCAGSPILLVPSTTSGYTLFGFPDDQETPACGPAPTGNGVWYRVDGNGKRITASLCGATDYDSRLLVFCGDCETGNLVCVAGNDDAFGSCGAASELSWCSEVGRRYSILVAGGPGAQGQFELILTSEAAACQNPASCVANCTLTCPGGSASENEPVCSFGTVDETNSGCGLAGTHFGAIQCGQTVCGTSGNYTNDQGAFTRDTDWFRFTLTQASTVTWTVRAEFLVQAFILNNECADVFAYAGGLGNACQTVAVTATLEPGTYNVFVSPQFFDGVACGSKWNGTLTCTPTAQNGACCLTTCLCVETSENDCLVNQFGLYFAGPGSVCSQTNCNPCPADFNNDGIVGTADLVTLLGSFGVDTRGDINCDGVTSTPDLVAFIGRFGKPCP